MSSESSSSALRYEATDTPSVPLSMGMGLQLTAITLAGLVFTPSIVVQMAGGSPGYLSWAIFSALVVSGLTTILQAVRWNRFGAGYVLMMGTSGAFIAVSISALKEGGPALLATLVIISSLFQFVLASKLAIFRRLITPTVAGLVIMLIAVTIVPIVFELLEANLPVGASPIAAPTCALLTLGIILFVALWATGILRLWAPVLGVITGALASLAFGLYDTQMVVDAAWIGVPSFSEWPGFSIQFGPSFWVLLLAFTFVTVVGAIETVGDAIAIQQVSWRKPRAVDFRCVQGAVSADGVGNLLSGLCGTVPNTTYSSSVSVTELTGVAARRVGVAAGSLLLAVAFLPKFAAILLAIPGPVVAAYLLVILAILFVVGMKMVVQSDLNYRKGIIAGTAFWLGAGFQNKQIFSDHMSPWIGAFLENGMTAGALVALLLTLFTELVGPKRRKLETNLNIAALPKINQFLGKMVSGRKGWDPVAVQQMELASEEAFIGLYKSQKALQNGGIQANGKSQDLSHRKILVVAREADRVMDLEFVAASDQTNLEDQLTLLDKPSRADKQDISLRLLKSMTSKVRHQQYHDTDIISLRIEPTHRVETAANI